MSAVRSFLFGAWLYACIFFFGLGLLLLRLFGRWPVIIGVRAWAHAVLLGARLICGIKVEVRGTEHLPTEGFILASKHQSMLDTVAPWTFIKDPAFVLKKELLSLPIYGWVVGGMKHIPIDREGGSGALTKMMNAAREAVALKRAIIIFPEGTRQEVGAAPDYKVGVAGIYRDLNAPCVPMALNTGLVWPARGLPSHGGTAVFQILPSIPPGLPRAAFMRELSARIETASNALAGATPATPESAPAPYRAQRRWLVLPFAIFGLLIVAYSAIWFKSKEQAQRALADWVQSEKAHGLDVGYKNARVVGYPLRFALEIEDLHRADPARGTAWTASRLRINALPYDLRHVIIESLGPQTFQFSDGRGWVLNMKSGLASIHVDKNGLKRLSAQVQDAKWTSSNGAFGSLKAFALQAAPKEGDATKIRFETEAVEGHIPEIKKELEAFGQDFKSIKAKGEITEAQTFGRGFSSGALDLWAAQKGAAVFESVTTSWGAADLKGAGQASFDRLRRPAGQIDFAIEDSEKLARALVDKGWLQGNAAENFVKAARVADIAGIGLRINLEAQDGMLSFWGVPLKELQPAYSPAVPDASGAPVAGG